MSVLVAVILLWVGFVLLACSLGCSAGRADRQEARAYEREDFEWDWPPDGRVRQDEASAERDPEAVNAAAVRILRLANGEFDG